MTRGLTPQVLAEIQKGSVYIFHLFKLSYQTPILLCTAYKDVVWQSQTYFATGELLEVPDIDEDILIRTGSINLSLSAVDLSLVAQLLASPPNNLPFSMHLCFLDQNGVIVPSPIEVFRGLVDSFDINEDTKAGSASISLTVANHWADFDKTAGSRTNSADQQLYYPGDKGFDFSAQIIKDLRWGASD